MSVDRVRYVYELIKCLPCSLYCCSETTVFCMEHTGIEQVSPFEALDHNVNMHVVLLKMLIATA